MADPRARATFDAWYARTGDHREAARQAGVSERTGRRWRPRPTAPPPPAELPAAVEPIGRDGDLQALDRWTRAPGLIAVTGPGGVGKTVLALAFARRWVARGGRAWFCDLSAVQDTVGACHSLADALGTPLGPVHGPDQAVDAVARELGGLGDGLVVVDGAERLEPSCLARWRIGGVRLLVTSRRAVDLRDAREHRLGGLDPASARALLVQRCGEACGGVVDGIDGIDGIDALVPLLDGLPLAIELAAARARIAPLDVLAERLAAHPAELGEGPTDLPTRHRSMDRVVDGSWALADPDERGALSAWAVFEAPFDAAAAAIVAGTAPGRALDLLHGLHRLSLLERVGDGFRVYGAVRDHVRRRAPASDDAVRRHGQWIVGRHPRDRELGPSAFASLEHHRGDLLAIALRADPAGDLSLRAALALAPLYTVRGPVADLPGLLAGAVAASADADPRLVSVAHDARGQALLTLGRSGEAADALAQALAAAVGAGDRRLEGRSRLSLGTAALFAWRLDEARARLTEALAIAREVGDEATAGRCLANLGVADYWRGDFAGARARLGEALGAHRRAGDASSAANTLALLGALHHAPPNQALARGYYEEALAVFQAYGDHRRAAAARAGLALVALEAGDLGRARDGFDRALDGFSRSGAPAGYQYQGFRGVVHHLAGRAALARADYDAAVAGARARADVRHEALFLAARGVLDGAGSALDQAALLAEPIGDPALTRLIARLRGGPPTGDEAADGPPELRVLPRLIRAGRGALRVDPDTGVLETPDGLRVDLRAKVAVQRLIARLVAERRARPGAAVSVEALFAAGWPGQQISAASAINRVQVALSTARSAGLRPILQSVDGGFRLDPSVPIDPR